MLAEFTAMGLDVPATILSSNPKHIIAKLRDIAHHDSVTATMDHSQITFGSQSTALATQASQFANRGNNPRKHRPNPNACCDHKHNPLSGHLEEECWTLHPGLYKKSRQNPPTGLVMTAAAVSAMFMKLRVKTRQK
ncbi:hypothetical protein PTTG_29026 [Puccinia triticina 1-1 BBBD Race 1]|uniref:Uncharacterized protein n=1 Tax=Puccinia triticina (isolate 1-1 / race 1 (BBBD)) TaxID=630390 RepID=A0A180G6Z5_PUCT1|nr:hypothetical protein PTTG_29026 [Puccinia triticina 1-1 BBBD Race 1]